MAHRLEQGPARTPLADVFHAGRPVALDDAVGPGIFGLAVNDGHGKARADQYQGPHFPVRKMGTGKHRGLVPPLQVFQDFQPVNLKPCRSVRTRCEIRNEGVQITKMGKLEQDAPQVFPHSLQDLAPVRVGEFGQYAPKVALPGAVQGNARSKRPEDTATEIGRPVDTKRPGRGQCGFQPCPLEEVAEAPERRPPPHPPGPTTPQSRSSTALSFSNCKRTSATDTRFRYSAGRRTPSFAVVTATASAALAARRIRSRSTVR